MRRPWRAWSGRGRWPCADDAYVDDAYVDKAYGDEAHVDEACGAPERPRLFPGPHFVRCRHTADWAAMVSPPPPSPPPRPPSRAWLARLVDIRPGEGASVAWATAYFFLLLCTNFLLKPVREALGIAGGADKLPMVWTGTLLLSLAVQPLFAALIARLPRRQFLPLVYHASVACFLCFRAAFGFAPAEWTTALGYAFYIWFSVFNLFALSVFWGFAADIFRLDQAKRLFAFISVGGTAGAVAGSALAGVLVVRVGGLNLLFVASVLLEIAVVCVHALVRRHATDSPRELVRDSEPNPTAPLAASARPKSMWRGFGYVASSPYLQGICAFTFFYTLFKTILYFQTGNLVSDAITSRDARSAYYANVDLAGNVLTLLMQLFVTGKLIRALGVTFALLTQPIVGGLACLGLGFMIWKGREIFGEGELALGLPPELLAVAIASVLFTASNYATAKPARESLYTVVERDVKYASKNFVDTFVYRAGDLIAAWSFSGLRDGLGVPLAAIALAGGPLAIVWLAVGIVLGRAQTRLARESNR